MEENRAQKCKSVPASVLPTVPWYLCLSPGSCCCQSLARQTSGLTEDRHYAALPWDVRMDPAFPAEQPLPRNALCGCGHLWVKWMFSNSSSLQETGEYRKYFCAGKEIQSSRPSEGSSESFTFKTPKLKI